ncbi:phage tail protein [Orrella sp. 11846]|uniref:phage tail protein n=1 Tax=Orrella sp. 11846 TaxID=3409913 RepID=UPI003B58C7F5
METFTWCPRVDASGEYAYRVIDAQFGDGYKQSVGDGLNTETSSWSLSFRGRSDKIAPIRNFLRARQGFQPFKWTPPLGDEGVYEARKLSLVAIGGGVYDLSVTFTQRFEP